MHRLSAYVIVHRTQSDQTPNAIRSDGGRKPIGRRTQTVGGAAVSAAPTKPTEQSIPAVSTAPTKQTGNLLQLSQLGFAACQSKNCTNQAIKPTILM